MSQEKIDIIQIYFNDDLEISNGIKVHIPKIREIVEYGEDRFWSFVSFICGNSTSMRLMLWKNGIDWCKVTDFQLFRMLIPNFTKEYTSIIFGDLDITAFTEVENEGNFVLVNKEDPLIQITEETYDELVLTLRTMFDYFPMVETNIKGRGLKESIIMEEEGKVRLAKINAAKRKRRTSTMLPLISFLVNYSGFKYSKKEALEMTIFEFMDSIRRIQNTESTIALIRGMYSGMIDASKIDKKEFDLLRDLYD